MRGGCVAIGLASIAIDPACIAIEGTYIAMEVARIAIDPAYTAIEVARIAMQVSYIAVHAACITILVARIALDRAALGFYRDVAPKGICAGEQPLSPAILFRSEVTLACLAGESLCSPACSRILHKASSREKNSYIYTRAKPVRRGVLCKLQKNPPHLITSQDDRQTLRLTRALHALQPAISLLQDFFVEEKQRAQGLILGRKQRPGPRAPGA